MSRSPSSIIIHQPHHDGTDSTQERFDRLPIDRYDHRRGLNALQIHQTIISKDERLWSATPSGLACYDGVTAQMFDRADGLASHGLRALAIHPDNTLWLGSDIGIEVLDISGYAPRVLWSQNIGTVNSLDIQEDFGAIGTSSGLFLWHGNQTVSRTDDKKLAKATIKSVKIGDNKSLWVASPSSPLIITGNASAKLDTQSLFQAIGQPIVLKQGNNGAMLIGGAFGVARYDSTNEEMVLYKTTQASSALHEYDGQIWTGIGSQVIRLQVGEKALDYVDTIFDDVSVNHLVHDRFDNIWMSTGNQALLRISSLRKTFTESHDTDIGAVLCVKKIGQTLYIGGSNGLINQDNQSLLTGLAVWDVHKDSMGKYWYATHRGLYCRINHSITLPYRHTDCDVISAPCRALAVYKSRLYVSSIRGLAMIDEHGVSEVFDPDGNSFGYVYSLHIGPKGGLWIATLGRGLFRLEENGPQDMNLPTFAPNANVYAVTHSPSGEIFIAHDNLITKLTDDQPPEVLVTATSAIAAWTIKYMDGDQLVAGTSQGLIVYSSQTGKIKKKISGNFDDVPWEFTTSRSLELANQTTVCCGLGSGFRKVDLSDPAFIAYKPEAAMTYARWRGEGAKEAQQIGDIKTGRWHLEIGLKTCWYLDTCAMRVRIEGFDEDWSEPRAVGPVRLTSLPAGHYVVKIALTSALAGTGPVVDIFNFTVYSDEK